MACFIEPGDETRQVCLARSADGISFVRERNADGFSRIAAGPHHAADAFLLKHNVQDVEHYFDHTRKNHRDSGSDAFKVSWKGADGGGTVLSSGHPLTGWRRLEDEPVWLAQAAKGRVWFIDLPAGSCVTALYGTEGIVPRAKGQGMIPQRLSDAEPMSRQAFVFPQGAIADVPDLHEAECLIIPVNQWTMNILPVDRVDFDGHIVHLAQPCTYPIGVPHCAPALSTPNAGTSISSPTPRRSRQASSLYRWSE